VLPGPKKKVYFFGKHTPNGRLKRHISAGISAKRKDRLVGTDGPQQQKPRLCEYGT